jgi:hypothetical protein
MSATTSSKAKTKKTIYGTEWPAVDNGRLMSNKSFNGYKLSSSIPPNARVIPLPQPLLPVLPHPKTSSSGSEASHNAALSLHAYSVKLKVNHLVELGDALFYIDRAALWQARPISRCIIPFPNDTETGDGLSLVSGICAGTTNGCLVMSQKGGRLIIAQPSSSPPSTAPSTSLPSSGTKDSGGADVLYSGVPLGPASPDFVVQSAVALPGNTFYQKTVVTIPFHSIKRLGDVNWFWYVMIDGGLHCLLYYFKEEFKVDRGSRTSAPPTESSISFVHGSQVSHLSVGISYQQVDSLIC